MILGLFILPLTLPGCSRVRIETQPPGARVLWSGTADPDDWHPWPPRGAWTGGGDRTAPFTSLGFLSDAIYVTAELDGYLRPLPQPVQLYAMRNEKVEFELVELPSAVEARMRAQGLVYHYGEWVNPAEHGLIEVDGVVMSEEEYERRQRLAQGLVRMNDRWVTPEEQSAAYAEEQRAKGLIDLGGGRWVTPEVAAYERTIAEEVESIKAGKVYADLDTPQNMGRVNHADAQVQFVNLSGTDARFLVSGPMSRAWTVAPYVSVGVSAEGRIILPAGRYEIAIVSTPETEGEAPVVRWGSWPLAGSTQYRFSWSGGQGNLRDNLAEFEMPDTTVDFDVPVFDVPELPEEPKNTHGFPPSTGGGGRGGGRGHR